MNKWEREPQAFTCDYCGGDKATNMTDMGDIVCDPCLIGRPIYEAPSAAQSPWGH